MTIMNRNYNIVFVVLTYRNTDDLDFFVKTNRINGAKIIVVNSYYDDSTLEVFKQIAESNQCDFLPVENKGYSYGNNVGIKYAINNYTFDYLIVSNADIEIKRFDYDFLEQRKAFPAVYGPTIRTLTGKNQNPFIVRYSKLLRKIFYHACLNKKQYLKYFIYGLNKVDRLLFLLLAKISKRDAIKIYSCHGSFIIINSSVLQKGFDLFNDNMFLFQEEHFFARQCALNNIPIYYTQNRFEIKHFEDGSAASISDKIISYSEESYIYYYEFFNKKSIGN